MILSRKIASIRAISATISASFSGKSSERKSGGGVIHRLTHIPRREASPFKGPEFNSPHPNPIWKVGVRQMYHNRYFSAQEPACLHCVYYSNLYLAVGNVTI